MLVISLEERLAYRGVFILGTAMRFLPILTQVFLWTAVFGATRSGDIAGYSRNDIVAYYLLTMVSRAFSSMPPNSPGEGDADPLSYPESLPAGEGVGGRPPLFFPASCN